MPLSHRASATLLVNIGMTLGIWSGIGAAVALDESGVLSGLEPG